MPAHAEVWWRSSDDVHSSQQSWCTFGSTTLEVPKPPFLSLDMILSGTRMELCHASVATTAQAHYLTMFPDRASCPSSFQRSAMKIQEQAQPTRIAFFKRLVASAPRPELQFALSFGFPVESLAFLFRRRPNTALIDTFVHHLSEATVIQHVFPSEEGVFQIPRINRENPPV